MRITTRQKIVIYILSLLVLLLFIGPILWFILLAFREPGDTYRLPPKIFFEPTFESFDVTFFNPGNNARQLVNSFIVSTGTTLLSLPFSLAAAYALSRFSMRGKRFIMNWYISLLMAPPIVFIIPYFILMTRIGWAGSYQAMIVVLQTITIPFSVWLLKSFMDDVPIDLEEAALVDGASHAQAFFSITLPLALPGIIVTAMFAFVFSWNNVIFPLILSKQQTATLPVGTISFFASTGVYWNQIAATAVVAMLPPMLIFLALGRYVVRGLTFGAVKG
ncbi:MAG: carbohydrate ABC transporter permease [Anaerolineales bacterium]|nr:carbohydrate ABC transporter permease [Anaerolineales bacterium]